MKERPASLLSRLLAIARQIPVQPMSMTRTVIALCAFNSLLILVLWWATIGLLATEREQTINTAITTNNNLAIALEQYVRNNLWTTDIVLRQLIRKKNDVGKAELDSLVNAILQENRNFPAIALTDEDGMVSFTTLAGQPAPSVSIKDREHFRVHIDNDSDRVFVGKPVFARITKLQVVPLSRRINKPDGSFGGVAIALLEPAGLTRLFYNAELRPLDVFSIIGLDGITRARLRGTIPSAGEDISFSPLFKEQSQRANGHYYARDVLDGEAKYFSYRTLPEYHLLVTVGKAESDVLAAFNLRKTRYTVLTGIATALILLFTLLVVLSLRRQQKAAGEIARHQAQHNATFNQSAIGMAHVDTDFRLLDVNQKLCDMLGYRHAELLGKTLNDITHPDDIENGNSHHRRRLDGNDDDVLSERRLQHRNGSTVWCLQAVSPIHDSDSDYCAYVIQDISDRKWLEFVAHSGVKQYQALLNLLPIATYTCTLSGDIETYNDSAVELWGRVPRMGDEAEKYCGSLRLFDADGTPIPRDEFPVATILRNDTAILNQEAIIERPDGSRRTVLLYASPRHDANNKLTGTISCVIDITERLEAARKARDLMHSLIEASPIGIVTYRAAGPAVFANTALAGILGCSAKEAATQNFREIAVWQNSGLLAKAEEALATGKLQSMELNSTSSFGKDIALECRLIPFLFFGEPHLLCFFDDLSEEKQTLSALRASEARLKNAQRIAQMGHWDLDIQTNALHWSEQIFSIFGIDKTCFDANYATFLERVHPDDRPAMERAQRAAISGADRLDFEHRIVLPDGTVKFVHELGELTRDTDDRPLRLSGTVSDITHRKALENAMRDKVQQMRQLAQRLNTVEETERRNIHRELHDQIGTNLSTLKLDLNLIEAGLDANARAAVAERMRQAQELAMETIVRVRNVMAELRPLALDDFGLLDALRVHADSCSQRLQIPFLVTGDPVLPRLPIAVETGLFRIAQEAINNIIKHARARQVDITLRQQDGHVTLIIRDDGIGFDITTTDPRRSRWGLGTMHERALAMNAQLHIDSVPGAGTQVNVVVSRSAE